MQNPIETKSGPKMYKNSKNQIRKMPLKAKKVLEYFPVVNECKQATYSHKLKKIKQTLF